MNCRSCGTSYKEAQKIYLDTNNRKYFFETCYGDYCCQDEECVYSYVMEHEQIFNEEQKGVSMTDALYDLLYIIESVVKTVMMIVIIITCYIYNRKERQK